MANKVLVTGASGFVGSHILEALMKRKGVEVVAACRKKSRLLEGFKGEVRVGDLRDSSFRKEVVSGIDILCHAAAWTSLWGNADASRALFLEPSIALIEEAHSAGVRRFVNTSTTSASSPKSSSDSMSRGIKRSFWPHLCNVIAIEDTLREKASREFNVVNLRLGIFAGQRYALGLLPILVPRLKTHLVPWVGGGKTSLPIVDGRDIGEAFALAATNEDLTDYESFNIVGPEIPKVREVFAYLHEEFSLPLPHFGVPFGVAYPFAALMEIIDPIVPWEPLVTRSIIHLMEETNANNEKAARLLGYRPTHGWRDSVAIQIGEMSMRREPMPMARPLV